MHILGDGNQTKSFLHVEDCVEGMIYLVKNAKEKYNLINLSSGDTITIRRLAEIVAEEMNLKNVSFVCESKSYGWKGDVTKMFLDTQKAKKLGWSARYNSEQAVRKSIKDILAIE